MKRTYITAIPLDSNFAIAPYAAQAANYQQTYTAPSCYPITPIIAATARPGDEITVLAERQKNSPRSDNLDAFRRELDTRPGELYNRALLMRTIRLLGSM